MAPSSKRRKLSNGAATAATPSLSTTTDSDKTTTDDSQPKAATRSSSLFVRSLPSSVTNDSLAAHFSDSFPLKHATVVLDPTTKISRGFGFVTFTDPADAASAAAEFDGSVLEGRKIRVEIAESRHRDAEDLTGGALSTTQAGAGELVVGDGGKITKKGAKNTTGERLRKEREDQQKANQVPRLIVRNLPWSIQTGEELAKLFQSYGKVKHAVVPKKGGGGRAAGYGFGIVILRGRKNAERALEGVNGKEVDGRVVAVDWMAERGEWEKVKEEAMAVDVEGDVDGEEAEVADEDDQDEGEVDAAAKAIDSDAEEDEEDAALSSDAEDAEFDADADLPDLKEAEPKPSTDNTTIFIRNLPYTTDDLTLREHFTTHFGPTRYARVVYDHTTERSKGTGFVCFVDESTAKECVISAPKKPAFDPTTTSSTLPSRHLTPHSILQNPAQDPTGAYTLDGRILQISRFLPKPTADALTSSNALSREKARERDKRRLYLLSEGTVPRGSKLYAMLSKPELDMREASAKQRQKLIKMNPNLGLSLTRLSVRNLPRWMDSKRLKALAREAIVGFASDVREGKRTALSPEENRRGGEEMKELEQQRKKKGVGIVKQAKIVFEGKEGGKVKEGMGGRSRGYGFVEYWSHRAALGGLRWMNGYVVKGKEGVEGGERGKRLIVEFAIENAQVVQRREGRERRGRERREGEWEEIEDGGDVNSGGGKAGGRKRKRSEDGGNAPGLKKPEVAVKEQEDAEEKNKVAKRNRIIAKKRSARKARKG